MIRKLDDEMRGSGEEVTVDEIGTVGEAELVGGVEIVDEIGTVGEERD